MGTGPAVAASSLLHMQLGDAEWPLSCTRALHPELSALCVGTPVEYLHSPGRLRSQQAQKGGLASAGAADLLGLLKYTVCRNLCFYSGKTEGYAIHEIE